MKTPEPSSERPLAWMAILDNTPVHSADGAEIGNIHEVLGAEDIFHGIVVRSGLLGRDVFIPADRVTVITNERVNTSLSTEEARDLPPYEVEESFNLGFVGLFKKHLGWVEGENRHG